MKLTVRSDGKPVLTWKKIDGAAEYEMYHRVDGGNFTRLTTDDGTKSTNSSAKTGGTYTYEARAVTKRSVVSSSGSSCNAVTVK